VVIDCGWNNVLTSKEKKSLGKQIAYCYSFNRKQSSPVWLRLSGADEETKKYPGGLEGFPARWELFEETGDLKGAVGGEGKGFNVERDKCIYLTADAKETVEKLEPGYTYVIGGIVDRNRLTNATVDRATDLGVECRKLALGGGVLGTKVLTVNHVFEILCRGRDGEWGEAVEKSIPKRKGGHGEDEK
jgi:tRNA (guanine9-N1)-methyltransferase